MSKDACIPFAERGMRCTRGSSKYFITSDCQIVGLRVPQNRRAYSDGLDVLRDIKAGYVGNATLI